MKEKKVVAVSGGFDPIHVGHLELFKEAKELGDELVVILNNDVWLRKKKGYAFMPQDQRKKIIKALKYVDRVVLTSHREDDLDMSVCMELEDISPDIFANGGDRKSDNVPEVYTCNNLDIELAWNIGGEKAESSSELVLRAMEHLKETEYGS